MKHNYVICRLQILLILTDPNPVLCWKRLINPLPDDNILDWSKLKAFADDKLNVTKMIISVFDRVENIVGKGEIACTSNFSFSHNVFKRLLTQRRQKVSLWGNGLTDVEEFERQVKKIRQICPVIDCMVFNAVSNIFSVISRRPLHLSMLSWNSFNQYSAQYSFQATSCFPT